MTSHRAEPMLTPAPCKPSKVSTQCVQCYRYGPGVNDNPDKRLTVVIDASIVPRRRGEVCQMRIARTDPGKRLWTHREPA